MAFLTKLKSVVDSIKVSSKNPLTVNDEGFFNDTPNSEIKALLKPVNRKTKKKLESISIIEVRNLSLTSNFNNIDQLLESIKKMQKNTEYLSSVDKNEITQLREEIRDVENWLGSFIVYENFLWLADKMFSFEIDALLTSLEKVEKIDEVKYSYYRRLSVVYFIEFRQWNEFKRLLIK